MLSAPRFSIAAAASAGGAVAALRAFTVRQDVLVVGRFHLIEVGLHDAVGEIFLLVGAHRVAPAAACRARQQQETQRSFQKNTANPPEYSWRFSVALGVK